MDPIELTRALIRCPSVTPTDAGAIELVAQALEAAGFTCHRLTFEGISNLYARLGTSAPNFCFAGHTDVVPPGERAAWSVDPFAGELRDGRIFGRGAVDMKGGVACFVAALTRFAPRLAGRGSLSVLVTGDEEGQARYGTRAVLEWLAARGERLDACLVGEPTSEGVLGATMKIGRRGSLNVELVVHGTQGHVAYPHLADNPVHALVALLARFTERRLDEGTAHFAPSSLQVTSVDVGNPAHNVIPATARARLNIRFNDRHTSSSLLAWLREACEAAGVRYELIPQVSGEAFVTPPGPLSRVVSSAVQDVLGRAPEASTSGGTSDARFLKDVCPVVELGLVNATMHKVDEQVPARELEQLTRVYERVLERFFSGAA